MRLDSYLASEYPEHSRSVWQKFIKQGVVRVNDVPITELKYRVNDSDTISYVLSSASHNPIDLPIIYEDDNVIVINKPAGILTHSKGALNDEFTVSDFIKLHSSPNGASDKLNNRYGIVHRLDRATSGVMISAKNGETLKFLQKQFSGRKVKKTYLAKVEKAPKNNEFIIDLPIARNPKKPATFKVDSKGKSAVTNVKIIEKNNDGTALLELKPLTGRTHQLRVHLSHIGSPIVGDIIYGKDSGKMHLHANSLEITLPGGDRKIFKALLPKEFKK